MNMKEKKTVMKYYLMIVYNKREKKEKAIFLVWI
jgi:hypothetical protein